MPVAGPSVSAARDGLPGFRLEWAPPQALAQHVSYLWAQRTHRADPLLPDAAVELVWSGRGLFVRGADTCRCLVDAFPSRTLVGVRFRIGAAPGVLGISGPSLADARIGVSELWGVAEAARVECALRACASPRAAAAVLAHEVQRRVHEPPDPVVEAVVAELNEVGGSARVRGLAHRLGLSERQLRRRCIEMLGYGPKTLDRILRFQRFRALSTSRRDLGLARLAASAGYADQPHLTRECVRLAGETPTALLARLPQAAA